MRYWPMVRQLKSGKTNNIPGRPFSSLTMLGDETSVPINLRANIWPGWAGAMSLSSCSVMWLMSVQWRASMPVWSVTGAPVAEQKVLSSMMGGGSITRRSRSPKPQARAAMGCWRMVSWKVIGGGRLIRGFIWTLFVGRSWPEEFCAVELEEMVDAPSSGSRSTDL